MSFAQIEISQAISKTFCDIRVYAVREYTSWKIKRYGPSRYRIQFTRSRKIF